MRQQATPESVVYPIHFEDRDGDTFERLCLAHLSNALNATTIDWYGQLGGDSGRDIWATVAEQGGDVSYCFQCANHRKLYFEKAQSDINKVLSGPNGRPDVFIIIVGGRVSAQMKAKIYSYAATRGISRCEIWSSAEFEERLRRDTPQLLRRFCNGEPFPEDATDLRQLATSSTFDNDQAILNAFAECFDRPAFLTPFHRESSIEAFKKAITDTIEALNTGLHRLRDGTLIRSFPPRHCLRDSASKRAVAEVVDGLINLRAEFDSLCKSGEIRPCNCTQKDCPVFESTWEAAQKMNSDRYRILEKFASICDDFELTRYMQLGA